MAIELATAYVSLTTSARGISDSVQRDMQPVSAEAGRVGDEAGKKAGGKFSGAMGGVVGTAAKGAAIFGGVEMIGVGFSAALDKAALPAQLQAEFGLTAPIAKQAAETAGDLYAQGWGASLGEIGAATAETQRALSQLGTGEDVGKVTVQAQALADTFGEEVNPLLTASAQMVKTGMAPSMEAAFDIMAKGFQGGANQGQDFLDTITEYGGQFQKLGLDGATSVGLLNQALRAGARDSDFVADAIKEFSIRAVDGSKTSAEGFELMGLNAQKMTAQIAQGGPAASAGLQLVLDKLRAMKDPVEREAAAVALFGTKAEDLGKSLFALNPATVSATGGMKDMAGAAQGVADTVGGTTKASLDALSRSFSEGLGSALTTVEPLLSGLLKVLGPFMPLLGPAAIAIAAVAAAQWLWNAALAANPIGLVVVAIAALVGGLIWAWNNVDGFKEGLLKAWDSIKTATTAVKDWVVARWNEAVAFFSGVPAKVSSIASGLWTSAKNSATDVYNWVVGKLGAIVSYVTGIPGRIRSALSSLFSPLIGAARSAFNAVARGWNSTMGGVSFSVPSWVPGFGGNSYSFPQMGYMARGGIMSQGWSVVGEEGPELVHKAGASVRVFSHSKSMDMVGGGGGGSVSVGRLVEISGPVHVRSDQDILALSRGIARESARKLRALGVGVSLSGATP